MIPVTCAIIFKESKILVAQRSASMKQALKWEFPGGKIEAHETAAQCLLREIKEELNIEIEIIQQLEAHIYDYGNFSIQLIPFVCKYSAGDIVLAEHKDYQWIQKEELPTLDWAPADVAVVEAMLSAESWKYKAKRSKRKAESPKQRTALGLKH